MHMCMYMHVYVHVHICDDVARSVSRNTPRANPFLSKRTFGRFLTGPASGAGGRARLGTLGELECARDSVELHPGARRNMPPNLIGDVSAS